VHNPAIADGQRQLARFEFGDAQQLHSAVGKAHQALLMVVLDRLRRKRQNCDRGFLAIGLTLGSGGNDFGRSAFVAAFGVWCSICCGIAGHSRLGVARRLE